MVNASNQPSKYQSYTILNKTQSETYRNQENLLTKLALKNRILTAEPIAPNQAVSPGRYQINICIKVPGQWSRREIERVLELTDDWGWDGVLDLKTLAEIQTLLDAVASRGGAS